MPTIIGREKEMIEVTPYTAATIVTASIATIVVIEVLMERVRD